jgi:predicted amidohydrolase YtcJ
VVISVYLEVQTQWNYPFPMQPKFQNRGADMVRPMKKPDGVFILMLTLLSFAAFFSYSCGRESESADMVLLNGKVVTMDEGQPVTEALAIRGDSIVSVGSNVDIRRHIGESTRVVDIGGMLAIPGFIDGHGHLLMLGRSKMNLDLSKAKGWDEIVSIVEDKIRKSKPGEWIIGSGWHQEKWDRTPSPELEGYPTDETLSGISPKNPVLLKHASGHALFANAEARRIAGVTKETADTEGGRILRDSKGNPMGVFFDTAQRLISKAHRDSLATRAPEEVEAYSREAMRLAVQECLTKGVTSFQDASSSFQSIELYKKLVEEKGLGIRLWVMVSESNKELRENLARYRIIDFGDKRLTVRAVKKFMDGALGSHTAWLLEPYTDLPGSTGLNVDSPEEIMETARIAMKHGFQLCVHGIGDRANREILNIYETVFKENPNSGNLRWRIEHAQHLSAADIPRFARLGVLASMQAVHCTSDGPWVIKRLGAQRAEEGAYVWRKLMRSEALVTNGTDAPVEDLNPLANFYAAVTRKLPNGSIFYPDQRMSREEALRSCTINNAYAAFEEDSKGSLVPGKLADVTILSKDIMTVSEDEILSARVVYTIVGGRIMYQRQ